jgi:hypothetical protein
MSLPSAVLPSANPSYPLSKIMLKCWTQLKKLLSQLPAYFICFEGFLKAAGREISIISSIGVHPFHVPKIKIRFFAYYKLLFSHFSSSFLSQCSTPTPVACHILFVQMCFDEKKAPGFAIIYVRASYQNSHKTYFLEGFKGKNEAKALSIGIIFELFFSKRKFSFPNSGPRCEIFRKEKETFLRCCLTFFMFSTRSLNNLRRIWLLNYSREFFSFRHFLSLKQLQC